VKINRRSLAIALAITASALTGNAVQADDMVSFATGGYATGLRNMTTMHMIDTDHDGTISQDEWTAFQNMVFSALDKGNTGFIDSKEFYGDHMGPVSGAPGAFVRGLRTKAMFDKIGAKDGKISREDFLAYQQKIFDMMDMNHDKKITAGEFIVSKH
jgi:Ca2+-binding EF-hand superfamily protein